MKDAATNQSHHGMRVEDMLSYLCDSAMPIIGTTSAESAKWMGTATGNDGKSLCLLPWRLSARVI